jgi:Holliday junction resolvasome RuvABC endonuclease subunit
MDPRYLLAVDPSLTCSGWALFDLRSERLCGVGKVMSLPASLSLSIRLADLQSKITTLFSQLTLANNDVLVCEGETTMRDPRAVIKVEQVRSIFESVGRAGKVIVPGRVNPRSVQSELMGFRGRQVKREVVKATARQLVETLYADRLKELQFCMELHMLERHQDIVDAILVGRLALLRLKAGLQTGQKLTEILQPQRRARRTSRFAWGKGEGNSFGWSASEIEKLTGGNTGK